MSCRVTTSVERSEMVWPSKTRSHAGPRQLRRRSDQFSKIMPMKTKTSQFDGLVARYYPAVYGLAARLTDDPREAIALTRTAFSSAQKQLSHVRNKTSIAAVLLTAVLRAGLASG